MIEHTCTCGRKRRLLEYPFTCNRCGTHWLSPDGADVTVTRPTIREKAKRLAVAASRMVSPHNPILATDTEIERRVSVCSSCEHYRPDANAFCAICGCTRVKMRMQSEQCPLGRWEYGSPEDLHRWFTGRDPVVGPDTRKHRLVTPVSNRKLYEACHELSTTLRQAKATSIIGVPRSGMTPASIVACELHLPLFVMLPDGPTACHGLGTRSSDLSMLGRRPVIIDDTCHNGGTILRLREQYGRAYRYAAVFCRPQSAILVDYFVKPLESPHVLEWNIINTAWSAHIGIDMDGLICDDCPRLDDDDGRRYLQWMATVRPRQVPRYQPVRAIITGRLEKYRAITEDWLAKFGAVYEHLVMCPDMWTKVTRLPEWKASQADRLGCEVFVESDIRMAEAINQYTSYCTAVAF